ncbi:hypothetical protein OBBRIDRAFT_835543 [Obba rivulosa]|uniref:Uncharacterized protein n=1 Tax=Obba rivulosa TaxID=1052685 RepID=A0A8E2B055_9APHY|nr:hypothetical protein OBBRIDRAFT_835543 [Obba rivulosa]
MADGCQLDENEKYAEESELAAGTEHGELRGTTSLNHSHKSLSKPISLPGRKIDGSKSCSNGATEWMELSGNESPPQGKILTIEEAVLIKPSMKTVRQLHILQEDLIFKLHKRTLEPIKTLFAITGRHETGAPLRAAGCMSQKSSCVGIYNHMEYILTSLDMFAGISENLVNYTFQPFLYR